MNKLDHHDPEYDPEAYMDSVNDTDENGYYPGEAEAELDEFINSLEARLAGFTSQELIDEYYRRLFEPYNTELEKLKDKLDTIVAPF